MNRRTFIKSLSAACAAIVAGVTPKFAKAAKPSRQYEGHDWTLIYLYRIEGGAMRCASFTSADPLNSAGSFGAIFAK